jgi:ATP-dependent Clp protease adapter protein ClpS
MNELDAPKNEVELQRPMMKTLVIHNADDVSFQQVWAVLSQSMHLPIQICCQLALQAHRDGTADLFTASREVVEARLHACERVASAVGCEQLPFSVRDA